MPDDRRLMGCVTLVFGGVLLLASFPSGQAPGPQGPPGQQGPAKAPRKLENLQVLPKDSTREQVIARMREFTFALGVRCDHCHDVPEGTPLDQADLASDVKEAKKKARVMMKMTADINNKMLPDLCASTA